MLIAPVVRDADRRSVLDLAKEIARLGEDTKSGPVKPEDLGGSRCHRQDGTGVGRGARWFAEDGRCLAHRPFEAIGDARQPWQHAS
ncbi:hypothetical protein BE04_08025 [Sorangium cellulosum]|uniref:2-oxoacid dehydrogenase acyltransferase catalytic domain-containing protein n=1 Tax=Sorangium cellulosum TaxID=56 RepID=A0A150PQ29_SORCE|nr:hypothetical protein BE04_08025 [Sorangium cellulosum]